MREDERIFWGDDLWNIFQHTVEYVSGRRRYERRVVYWSEEIEGVPKSAGYYLYPNDEPEFHNFEEKGMIPEYQLGFKVQCLREFANEDHTIKEEWYRKFNREPIFNYKVEETAIEDLDTLIERGRD